MKLRNKTIVCLFLIFFAAAFTACSDDDVKYNMTDDIFRPILVQDPLVERNTILLVWYEIYDAENYTVQLALDKNFTDVLRQYDDYEGTILRIDDIPYATKFFIRMRANSPLGEKHSSAWTQTFEVSTEKRIVPRVLSVDKETDLGKDFVVLRWTTDYEINPVDSIGIAPSSVVPGAEPIGKKLTAQDLENGYVQFDNLPPNTSYLANIYNTQETSVYNQPYNEVRFRTMGDPIGAILIPNGTDLTAYFVEVNANTGIPDGAVFLLEAGGVFTLHREQDAGAWGDGWDGVTPNKGFTLMGDIQPGVPKPIVYLQRWFSFSGDASIMAFENIDFRGMDDDGNITENNANYLCNFDSDMSIDLFRIHNCTFRGIGRGIIRTKSANNKFIGSIEITDSRFYDVCWKEYNYFSFGSESSDEVPSIYFEGCTFVNSLSTRPWLTGDVIMSLEEITVMNCTFYSIASQSNLLNFSSSRYDAVFENNLFAGGTLSGGATLRNFTGTLTSELNYSTTRESTSNFPIGAIYLGTPDEEEPYDENTLFRDAANDDFTIVDTESPVYENFIGDPFWL